MDVSELPVSQSGGPRVDVDALEAELEDSRLDASNTAGQLADALAQVEALTAERGELRAKIDAMEQSYREARSMWPEGQTHDAWAELVQFERARRTEFVEAERNMARKRGDVYRARALALLKQARYWHEIDCQDAESVMHAIRSREAAEARLAAQQGAQRYALELRGLLGEARRNYWVVMADGFVARIDAALASISPHATREEQQSFARSAGQAPAGGETETR